MEEEKEQWELVTGMTMAYCRECFDNDNVRAYMDMTSEWMMSPGWKQTIQCKRCNREVEQMSKTSHLLNLIDF